MKIREIKNSLPILGALSLLLFGLTIGVTLPAAAYIVSESDNIVTNFYLTGLIMLLSVLTSGVIGLFVIRLIWGPAIEQKHRPIDDSEDEESLDEAVAMRGMRATGTKKIAVFLAVLAINVTVFDILGKGVLISDTRAVKVMTLLRSQDGQDRADAVTDAIILVGDPRIEAALIDVIEKPGASREWAAYAAGIRHDQKSRDALVTLLKTGNDRERAAAAVALARLGDDRLIDLAANAYTAMKTLNGDILKALGMLGYDERTPKDSLAAAGRFLTKCLTDPKVRADEKRLELVLWAIGRLRAPEALLTIEDLLASGVNNAVMCIGLEAIGRIGSASSSPKLLEAIPKFRDGNPSCPEVVYADFTGHEVLLTKRMTIVERLLHEIAHIGDRRARPEILKISKDKHYAKTVRSLAAEIAFQMKYKVLEKPEL
jgi:HEAT repeat protein